ncbi:integrase core domain-containing protein [Gordonia hongkongensis]|uniref:integrase core domain-containing protein n=1 Tax=Gordonia TaxID=2053 RepID=UPI0030D014D3
MIHLDETGAFDTIETAQTAIDEWVHAYNTCRPHQSLNMATPASVFRSRSTDPDTMPSKPVGAEIRPEAEVVRPAPTVADQSSSAIEFDTVVPPSGVVTIAGVQQVWVGKKLCAAQCRDVG